MTPGAYIVNLRVPEGAALRGFTIHVRPDRSKRPNEAKIVAVDAKDDEWALAFAKLTKERVFLDTLREGETPHLTGTFQLQYVVGSIVAVPA